MIGDLSLLGVDLCGHVVAYRSGHPLNVELTRRPAPAPDGLLDAGGLKACGYGCGMRNEEGRPADVCLHSASPFLIPILFRKGFLMTRLPVAVVGVGHLGKEHARILASLPEVELVGVADPNRTQAEAVAQRCPTRACTDHRALLGRVRRRRHRRADGLSPQRRPRLPRRRRAVCWWKSPWPATSPRPRSWPNCPHEQGTLVQVGHIERFNPAFEELQSRPIRPRYLVCERCSGFSGRSTDVGVVLDLMIHDLDLVLALVRSEPVQRSRRWGRRCWAATRTWPRRG